VTNFSAYDNLGEEPRKHWHVVISRLLNYSIITTVIHSAASPKQLCQSEDMSSPAPLIHQNSTDIDAWPLKTSSKLIVVAIIGAGYVGEHLIEVFSSAFQIIGYDVSASRIELLRSKYLHHDNVKFSNDERDLKDASHFLVCVPTTLEINGRVDSSHVRSAIGMLHRYVSDTSVVVIESTVAVGMTREFLGPLAKSHGIFAGMSPEARKHSRLNDGVILTSQQRIDPGRVEPPAKSIPKVVSGLDDISPGSSSAITRLYKAVFDTVIPVSKPEVAEMSKLYENCQRTLTIAYANEMADACLEIGIDPFEVANTSASKPFGYLPMYPSLGIGGHCIPVNPVYFMSTCDLPLLQQAHERMMTRPTRIASRLLTSILEDAHEKHGATHQPSLLVVGMGFKAGQSDLSHSPGLQLLNFMRQSGEVDLTFCDPYVEQESIPEIPRLEDSLWKHEILNTFSAIVVAVKQPTLDYGILETLKDVRIEVWQR